MPSCRPTRSWLRRRSAVLSPRFSPPTISRCKPVKFWRASTIGISGSLFSSLRPISTRRALASRASPPRLTQQQAKIEEAKADVANMTAALDFATEEQTRYGALLQKGAGTIQRSHLAESDLLQKQAALDKAKAGYDAAQKQTEGLRSLEAGARASLQRAEINLEQAKLNLEYTTIAAPIDGVVGDRALRKGQLVQPGSNLLTLVPMGKAIYLVANFKETQVGAMAEGQAVTFTVDAFGDHLFHGRVDSFAPGTGAQFALLPPENATGNFTKIVQRVPVKILLDEGDPLIQRLRPGLSAEATIDTRDEPNQAGRDVAMKEQDARF